MTESMYGCNMGLFYYNNMAVKGGKNEASPQGEVIVDLL